MFKDSDGMEVVNYGKSGTTMMKKGGLSYWNATEYDEAMASEPDIVVLMLGTNDGRYVSVDNTTGWDQEEFKADYLEMAREF
jgi:lysophospholipase L1-like esterase